MKRIFLLSAFGCFGIFGLFACGGGGNTNITVNTTKNAMSNALNTVANTAGNVANTMSNTISDATAPGPSAFLTEAAQGGMAEVELGKLAASKAQSPEVKKFGQMMVTDHTKANTELKALATKKNIAVPSDIGSHKSTVDKLSGLSGADFDKEYVSDMVSDHEADVKEFQKQADSAADPDVKAFAAKTLPVLKKHLDAIKAIQAKMK